MNVWHRRSLIMEFAFAHLFLEDPFVQSLIPHPKHKYSVFTGSWQKKNIKKISKECKNSGPVIFSS